MRQDLNCLVYNVFGIFRNIQSRNVGNFEDVLKTSIFAHGASFLGQIFVSKNIIFLRGNYQLMVLDRNTLLFNYRSPLKFIRLLLV